jgi:DNA-binding NarL/FixJ family response regulator
MTELANGFQLHLALPSGLTRREIEVLHLLSHGMSNRDIAQKLFVSVRTVEAHLRSLYGKLDVSSRTEAALWAVRHGYAPLME